MITAVLAISAMLSVSLSPAAPATPGAPPGDEPGPAPAGEGPAAGTAADAFEGDCEWEGLDDRCEAWTADGAAGGRMAVSPTGDRLFTWGNVTMAAHDAHTGEMLWETAFAGIGSSAARVEDLAVSPDGQQVYAIGDDVVASSLHANDRDVIVAAYDGATGMRQWNARLGLPAIDENDRYVSRERAHAVAASPDGRRVYLTGDTRLYDRIEGEWITNDDVLVAGFDAGTGTRHWVTTWGDRFAENHGQFIVVSPDSRNVYVGGTYATCGLGPDVCPPDFLTLGIRAHRPAAPAQESGLLWDALYDGFGGLDEPSSLELAPDGGRVYLTGPSGGVAWTPQWRDFDWATVAYRTSTGEEAWVSRYQGPDDDRPDPLNRRFPDGDHRPSQLAVDPSGEKVFVTGTFQSRVLPDTRQVATIAGNRFTHEATLAYDAATGEPIWSAHPRSVLSAAEPVLGEGYASPDTWGRSVAVSPDGARVYAHGQTTGVDILNTGGQTTVGYDSGTGEQLWIARVARNGLRVAVHPEGMWVYTLSTNRTIQAYEAAS